MSVKIKKSIWVEDKGCYFTSSGSPIRKKYVKNEFGEVIEAGEYNFQEEIQKACEEADMTVVLVRLLGLGMNEQDIVQTLSAANGLYGDFSESVDIFKSIDAMAKCRSVFSTLKAEVKQLFNNNIYSFAEAVAGGTFYQKLYEAFKPSMYVVKEKEVNSNENVQQ